MDKLPPEILHNIFIQLELRHRLTCLTVCRNWWNVLDKGALFYNLIITSPYHFRRFMAVFERLPRHVAYVEEIYILRVTQSDFIKRIIFTTFPNVRMISAQKYIKSKDQAFRYIKKNDGVVYSAPKLEYLLDSGACTLVSHMLSLNLGGRLETLNLDFENLQSCQTVVSKLKGLPVLKRLYIGSASIGVHDLENVHNNIPSIQKFALAYPSILAGSMPSNIAPASFISKLKFKTPRYADAETCAQMYQYMTKKYTNLINVEYRDNGYHDAFYCKFNLSQQRYIYLNGALGFLKMIGSTQNHLVLNGLPEDVDVFEALDAGDSQIKSLRIVKCKSKSIFQYLAQSKQPEYIKKLQIKDTIVDCIHSLEKMTALTRLYIDGIKSYARPIHLEKCLAGCPPTLKVLTLRKDVVLPASFTKKFESVESLTLEVTDITCNAGDIISTCFPNLVRLVLRGPVTEGVHISLKNSHFQDVDIQMHERGRDKSSSKYGFSFKPPNMIETKYYMCSYQNTDQVDSGDIKGLPFLSVECFTERKTGFTQQDLRDHTSNSLLSLREVMCALRLY